MFVVISLIVGSRARLSPGNEGIAAFSTPTVVHFCAVLLISAILNAPWPAPWNASLLLGLAGLGGVIYVIIVLRRTRRQTDYQPVLEDWLWYTAFPFISYTGLVVAAIGFLGNPAPALFGIAAAMLLRLFTGIHNAWATVIFVAINRSHLGSRT